MALTSATNGIGDTQAQPVQAPSPADDAAVALAEVRRLTFWPLWTASVLLPLPVFLGGAYWTWQQADREAQTRLEHTAALLHEHASRAFEIQDAVLAAVQGRAAGMTWDEIAASREVWQFLRGLADATPTTSTIGMTSPDAIMVQIARGPFPPPVADYSDRDYVAAQRRAERDEPFVGAAIASRIRGALVIPHSRPRLGPKAAPSPKPPAPMPKPPCAKASGWRRWARSPPASRMISATWCRRSRPARN